MQLDRYDFQTSDTALRYLFTSEGPKGSVTKVVQFRLIDQENNVYNLAFGDWSTETNIIDDFAVTNNNDRDKVLATLASIVLHFSNQFPLALVFAQGSTPGRTRLYRIGIALNFEEISEVFEVYGLREHWELFRLGIDYDAFLVKRLRNSNFTI
jgi:hypothetical protein